MRRLLPLLILWACSDSPTAPTAAPPPDPLRQSADDQAIQRRLTGRVAWLDDGPARVTWAFPDSLHYRLEARTAAQGLVQWEQGDWWIGRGEADRLALVIDRREGAILQRDLSWWPTSAYRFPVPLLLLGRSLDDPGLQIRLGTGGGAYTYRLAPLDSLEAIKDVKP